MAIYHCHVSSIRNVVSAEYYRRRQASYILSVGIPEGIPPSKFWALVRQHEQSVKAGWGRRVEARDVVIALPRAPEEIQLALLKKFTEWLNREFSVPVCAYVHEARGHNPHAHILLATRSWNGTTPARRKNRRFNYGGGAVAAIRSAWLEIIREIDPSLSASKQKNPNRHLGPYLFRLAKIAESYPGLYFALDSMLPRAVLQSKPIQVALRPQESLSDQPAESPDQDGRSHAPPRVRLEDNASCHTSLALSQ